MPGEFIPATGTRLVLRGTLIIPSVSVGIVVPSECMNMSSGDNAPAPVGFGFPLFRTTQPVCAIYADFLSLDGMES